MAYVDGFVLAVPTANKDAYRKLAEDMVPVFKRLGAISVVECWGDDVPDGKVTSFPMAVKKTEDEAVVDDLRRARRRRPLLRIGDGMEHQHSLSAGQRLPGMTSQVHRR